jgi:carbon monoxide dehydrogenase subunit G
MLKPIAIAVVVVVGGFLIYAATRPDTFRVERTATIKAPPERIFPLINDFQRWGAWSPFEKKDPAMKRTLSGAPSGSGAVYEWDGNKEIGQGRMEIVESLPPSRVTLKLDFTRPFEAHNIVDFTLEPRGDSTQVTWAIHGPSPFISKVMGIVFNMDKMIGKDFEAGLAALKTVSEQQSAARR